MHNTDAPISDIKLMDSLGNNARITLHKLGSNNYFEVTYTKMGSVPVIYRNTLAVCQNIIDTKLSNLRQAGFVEYNQDNSGNHCVRV